MKTKLCYEERFCTWCGIHDIEDKYHILIKCGHFMEPRKKYLSKHYYCNPIMFIFKKRMSTTNKHEQYRLYLIYITIVLKDYNSRDMYYQHVMNSGKL